MIYCKLYSNSHNESQNEELFNRILIFVKDWKKIVLAM